MTFAFHSPPTTRGRTSYGNWEPSLPTGKPWNTSRRYLTLPVLQAITFPRKDILPSAARLKDGNRARWTFSWRKLSRQQILTLPNGLTVLRVLAVPFIITMLFSPVRISQIVTAFMFLLVAVTDTLDGYLARRRGMVTTLGKFLDPLADKLLIVAALHRPHSDTGGPSLDGDCYCRA